MKVLYLTNMHNPYRDEFFEQLGHECDLTVLFEQRTDAERDNSWFEGAEARSYKEIFLPESERGSFSLTMIRLVSRGWDLVIVGCYNSPRQIAAIEVMRAKRICYAVNLDGPLYPNGSKLKGIIRKNILKGANAYLVAGLTSVGSVRDELGSAIKIIPYPFTSLTEAQIAKRAVLRETRDKSLILCVGQFLPCKGIDVLLDAFANVSRSEMRLRIVGAGKRNLELSEAVRARGLEGRVTTVPFLSPEDLALEYAKSGLFVLPSRQECWGLVINEAAACGCPIVSTWGAGAAVEFISRGYPQYLAEPGKPDSLVSVLDLFFAQTGSQLERYSTFLREIAADYTIEKMVTAHEELFKGLTK